MNSRIILIFIFLLQLSIFAQEQSDYQLMIKAGRGGNYSEAINYGLKVVEAQPENSYLKLVLSSYYSLNNQIEPALEFLNKAVEEGEIDYRMIMDDPDFNNIKNTDRFSEILEVAKSELLDHRESKKIELEEGKWNNIELEYEDEFPKIKVSLKYDINKLEIKAEVNDLHFKDEYRSWRYGDGFFFNFVTPDNNLPGYSDKFYAYGFSQTKGNPVAVLVNKDGNYFLKDQYDILPDIKIDAVAKTAYYHISIPWEKLYPAQPLLDEDFGINIIYISRNDDGSRKIVRYIRDYFYDTENTNYRQYAPVTFKTSEYTLEQIKGEIEKRLLSSDNLIVNFTAYQKYANEGSVKFKILNDSNDEVYSGNEMYELRAGKNILTKKIFFNEPEGYYKLRLILNNKSIWEDTFYKYSEEKLRDIKNNISANYKSNNSILINSLDALSYRIQELEKSINNYSNRNDPVSIKDEIENISELNKRIVENNSIYTEPGYLLSGIKSSADSSLQPFSIILPENFDPEKEYNLYIGLHGSGVPEVGFVKRIANAFDDYEGIIIAPRGRGLSDWYLGKTETDILDMISKMTDMFNINRKLIFGFSMGGYGVWRMTHLHPHLFDAGIEISGLPKPWIGDPVKDDMNNFIGAAKDINFLVIHGTDDRGVPIDATDKFVAKCKSEGYNIEYHRIEGGGHGNFDSISIIKKWLKENF